MYSKFAKPTIVNLTASNIEAVLYCLPAFAFTLTFLFILIGQFPSIPFNDWPVLGFAVSFVILICLYQITYQLVANVAFVKQPNSLTQFMLHHHIVKLTYQNNRVIDARLLSCRVGSLFAVYQLHINNTEVKPTKNSNHWRNKILHLFQRQDRQYIRIFLPKLSTAAKKSLHRQYYHWRFYR